jgi:hypothetical protein
MVAIRAKFDGKTFVPTEPLDLPRGTEVTVHVDQPTPPVSDAAPVSALEWLANNVIDDDNLPTDLSYQHDHYLYGSPKKP